MSIITQTSYRAAAASLSKNDNEEWKELIKTTGNRRAQTNFFFVEQSLQQSHSYT